jgi:hypothetical protein
METYEAQYALIDNFECNLCDRKIQAGKVFISTKSSNHCVLF